MCRLRWLLTLVRRLHTATLLTDGTTISRTVNMAFDLGAVYKINDDWTVSAALIDLDYINWNNNMQAVNK